MNKTVLSIVAGFFSILIALPFYVPTAQAQGDMSSMKSGSGSMMDGMRKKRYRYRKRTHRVQGAINAVPWNDKNNSAKMYLAVDLLYGYNAGHFEIGPNLSLMSPAGSNFDPQLSAGIWGEFNFVKNTRKKRFVPAIGLKANYVRTNDSNIWTSYTGKNVLLLSPYLTAKYFPASRTGVVLNVNYNIVTALSNLFSNMEMGIGISLAYVHYFHF